MRKSLCIILLSLCCAGVSAQSGKKQHDKPYSKQVRKTERKLLRTSRSENKIHHKESQATPDLYWIQEYIATMDPAVGRPTPEVLKDALEKLNLSNDNSRYAMPGMQATPWTERGPNNVGGRTRALAWDPWDSQGKKVWAGGITGGLWYNSDITNSASSWQHVSGLWANLSISAIAFDPNTPGTMYVGTGEGYGASSSTSIGYGIWKSTDSGKTFTHLSGTASYYYVNDIIVRNEGGSSVIYAAVDANYSAGQWNGLTSYGLFRSTNGGTSFSNIAPTAANGARMAFADLELAADNGLYAGTRNNPYSGTDKGGGRILKYVSGSTWTVLYNHNSKGRVEIACAPGSAGLIYAVLESNGASDTLIKSHNYGNSWSSMSKPDDADLQISKWDFTRQQGWYNLILAVDPNDTNVVVIGGIDLFRSTNGGGSWSQISKWSNNANLHLLSCSYVHADQHQIAFKPGSSSTCIFGTDGGVFYTASLGSAATSNVISARNKDYNVTQFYKGDLSQTSGSNLMLAGSQDNGTQKFAAAGVNSTSMISGGDGGACFISASNNNRQVSSYVFNTYHYTLNNWSSSAQLINDGATGSFINPADWDDNGPGLFTGKGQGAIYRIMLTSGPGTLETVTWTATGKPSALRAEKLTGGKTRLFVGTDAGKLYRSNDAWATSPSFADITGTMNAGNVADVHSLRAGDTIAVILSNYGINNVYISTNGGSTWVAKDGNLSNQPVWSILLNPDKIGEAVVATETGVYGTTNIFASSPVWAPYTTGMGAVKVMQLRYRSSDKTMMAVTHGRGVFTSDAWGRNTPIVYFGTSVQAICSNQEIQLKDSSANSPTQWEWSISPPDFEFVNGTDSASQNPWIRFHKGGTYSVTLEAANQLGANSLTRTNYIAVTDTIPGSALLIADRDTLCNGDSLLLTAQFSGSLAGSIVNYQWKLGTATVNTGTSQLKILPAKSETYSVTLNSQTACVSPNPFTSNVVNIPVLSIVKPQISLNLPTACAGGQLTASVIAVGVGVNPQYKWYLNDSLLGFSTQYITIAQPEAGDTLYATVYVAGRCVFPTNLIHSDTGIIVILPTPAAPVVSRNYDTLFASAAGSGIYTWYLNGSVIGSGKEFRAPQNGGYRCIYTENGCSSDSSALIVFNSLGSSEIAAQTRIWPVPADRMLYIASALKMESVEIISYSGEVVYKAHVTEMADELQPLAIPVSHFSAGLYTVRIRCEGGSADFNFIRN